MTLRNKDARAQGHDEGSKAGGGGCSSRRVRVQLTESAGAAHGECGCSSRGVRGWWMLTINSHGIEISIARCVEEMVRVPNPMLLFFFFFFYIMCFVLINYWEQRLRAALAMVKKEPHPLFFSPTRHQGKSHQPKSLWYETNGTPATQNKKSPSD